MSAIRILTALDHYHPGWKAGGPVRAIRHLVARLGDSFSFDILTSDRDLGDDAAYPGIPTGRWETCGKARVMYLAPADRTWNSWLALLRRSAGYDLVYLNSLFSRSTMRILVLRRLGLLPPLPYLLAPRGELQRGALSLHPRRKLAWLAASRAMGLFEGLYWQAATHREKDDIVRRLQLSPERAGTDVGVAPDLPVTGIPCLHAASESRRKRPGSARVIFVSRIARKKNLDYALRVLGAVRGHVEFDIYGPIEDRRYWRECEALIARLPSNVVARYRGLLTADEVPLVFAQYDLFFFPTRGESFGHVVAEAMLAGCPVLTSDQTPWRLPTENQAGWALPLEQPSSFAEAVDRVVEMTEAELAWWSLGTRRACEDQGLGPDALEANRRLLQAAGSGTTLGVDKKEIVLTQS